MYLNYISHFINFITVEGRCGRDRMVVGVTITCAISVYHHRSRPGVLDTTLCDQVYQVGGILQVLWFPPPIKRNN
jgi:hypothetical protein